jgi:hypothetical protein
MDAAVIGDAKAIADGRDALGKELVAVNGGIGIEDGAVRDDRPKLSICASLPRAKMPAAPRPLVSTRLKLRIVTLSAPAKMPSVRSPVVVGRPKLRSLLPVVFIVSASSSMPEVEMFLKLDACHGALPRLCRCTGHRRCDAAAGRCR